MTKVEKIPLDSGIVVRSLGSPVYFVRTYLCRIQQS